MDFHNLKIRFYVVTNPISQTRENASKWKLGKAVIHL